MQLANKSPSKPKPLVIHLTRDVITHKPQGFQPILVKKLAIFPYKSDKAVPWKYAPQRPDGRKDEFVVDDLSAAKVINISSTSGVTRSRRIFATLELSVRAIDPKGETSKASPILDEEVLAGRFAKEEEDFSKKGISAEEVIEFLRIIQQSKFKVHEQLNKTLAMISLLGLLMNSEPHRALLVKILNEAHVAQYISEEGFRGIINHITANNCLTFADEEIPIEGRGHNRALHVSVKCLDHIMAKVLIENGSSLNVMPKTMLDKLPFNMSHLSLAPWWCGLLTAAAGT